jgi:Flp pilus assembly protein TadD
MESKLKLAITYHQKNQFKKAKNIYQNILITEPNNEQATFLLSTLLIQTKNFSEAITLLKKLTENYENYHYFSNLGIAYSEVRDFESAISSFHKSISLKNNFSHNYNNLGNIYSKLNNFIDAERMYKKALDFEINDSFKLNISNLYKNHGDYISAQKYLNEIQYTSHEFYDATLGLIEIYFANQSYSKIIERLTLHKKYYPLDESLKLFDYESRILSDEISDNFDFKDMGVNANLFLKGLLKFKSDNFIKAINFLEMIDDNFSFMERVDNLRAYAYFNLQKLENALSITKSSTNPSLKLLNGLIRLQNKDFKGFEDYLFRCKNLKPHLLYLNDIPNCKSLDIFKKSKVLIVNEQGIGDTFFYLNALKNTQLNNCKFLVNKKIYDAIKGYVNVELILEDERFDVSQFDTKIFLPDLLGLFIDRIEMNYRHFNSEILPLNNKIKIGFSWFSKNPNFGKYRSLPLDKIIFPFKDNIDEIEFYNLQYLSDLAEVNNVERKFSLNFHNKNNNYFSNINELISQINKLDLVITIDNTTAHISGFLGKITFLLVPKITGRVWYWHNDSQSTWYPNTKIYFFDLLKINESLQNLKNDVKVLLSNPSC